jgi:hypothetical protein
MAFRKSAIESVNYFDDRLDVPLVVARLKILEFNNMNIHYNQGLRLSSNIKGYQTTNKQLY